TPRTRAPPPPAPPPASAASPAATSPPPNSGSPGSSSRSASRSFGPILPFDHVLFDRLHLNPPAAEELDRPPHLLLPPRQQHRHDPDVRPHRRLPDVERHLRKPTAHLPDDRLLHVPARRKRQPAPAGILAHGT